MVSRRWLNGSRRWLDGSYRWLNGIKPRAHHQLNGSHHWLVWASELAWEGCTTLGACLLGKVDLSGRAW